MRRTFFCVLAGVVALGLLQVSPAAAQGFAVYEQSSCTTGRAGASVAMPCADGSAVFFNPAGVAFVPDQTLSVGVTAIRPTGTFTNNTTGVVSELSKATYPVPNIYYTQTVGPRLGVGIGVFAPYGLTTEWPVTSEGRFLGYKSTVQGLFVQPTVALKLSDRVAVGVGVDIKYVNVELRQRVDLSVQQLAPGMTFAAIGVPQGTDFADVQLAGHAYDVGYHLGFQAKATDRVAFGMRYLSGSRVKVSDGTLSTEQVATGRVTPVPLPGIPAGTPLDTILAAQFRDGAVLESGQKGAATLPLPDQFVIGTAFQATQSLMLLVDYQWTHWSMFDELVVEKENSTSPTVTVEDYVNTHGLRLGAEYVVMPSFVVRGGFIFNTAAAPDQTVTPNLPEGKRYIPTFGLSTQLSRKMHLDLYYMYLNQPERAGRSTDGGMAKPTAAVNNGIYNFKGNLFGATLAFRF